MKTFDNDFFTNEEGSNDLEVDGNGNIPNQIQEPVKQLLYAMQIKGAEICEGLQITPEGEIYLKDGTATSSIIKDIEFVKAIDAESVASSISADIATYCDSKNHILLRGLSNEVAVHLTTTNQTSHIDGINEYFNNKLNSGEITIEWINRMFPSVTQTSSFDVADYADSWGPDSWMTWFLLYVYYYFSSIEVSQVNDLLYNGTFEDYSAMPFEANIFPATLEYADSFRAVVSALDALMSKLHSDNGAEVKALEGTDSMWIIGKGSDWSASDKMITTGMIEVDTEIVKNKIPSQPYTDDLTPPEAIPDNLKPDEPVDIALVFRSEPVGDYMKLTRPNGQVEYKPVLSLERMLQYDDGDDLVESIPEVVHKLQELNRTVRQAIQRQGFAREADVDVLEDVWDLFVTELSYDIMFLENALVQQANLMDLRVLNNGVDRINKHVEAINGTMDSGYAHGTVLFSDLVNAQGDSVTVEFDLKNIESGDSERQDISNWAIKAVVYNNSEYKTYSHSVWNTAEISDDVLKVKIRLEDCEDLTSANCVEVTAAYCGDITAADEHAPYDPVVVAGINGGNDLAGTFFDGDSDLSQRKYTPSTKVCDESRILEFENSLSLMPSGDFEAPSELTHQMDEYQSELDSIQPLPNFSLALLPGLIITPGAFLANVRNQIVNSSFADTLTGDSATVNTDLQQEANNLKQALESIISAIMSDVGGDPSDPSHPAFAWIDANAKTNEFLQLSNSLAQALAFLHDKYSLSGTSLVPSAYTIDELFNQQELVMNYLEAQRASVLEQIDILEAAHWDLVDAPLMQYIAGIQAGCASDFDSSLEYAGVDFDSLLNSSGYTKFSVSQTSGFEINQNTPRSDSGIFFVEVTENLTGVEVRFSDSFGDGWNGGNFTLRNVWSPYVPVVMNFTGPFGYPGPAQSSATVDLDAGLYYILLRDSRYPEEMSVTINPISGCMDPSASNYNAGATEQGESVCEYASGNNSNEMEFPFIVAFDSVLLQGYHSGGSYSGAFPEDAEGNFITPDYGVAQQGTTLTKTFEVSSSEVGSNISLELEFALSDAYGDGWTGGSSGYTQISVTVTEPDGNVNNSSGIAIFSSVSSDTVSIDLGDTQEGTYQLEIQMAPAQWADEAWFTINKNIVSPVYGCMDPGSPDYNEDATHDDGSCTYQTLTGCMDVTAWDYNPFANDPGTCSSPLADSGLNRDLFWSDVLELTNQAVIILDGPLAESCRPDAEESLVKMLEAITAGITRVSQYPDCHIQHFGPPTADFNLFSRLGAVTLTKQEAGESSGHWYSFEISPEIRAEADQVIVDINTATGDPSTGIRVEYPNGQVKWYLGLRVQFLNAPESNGNYVIRILEDESELVAYLEETTPSYSFSLSIESASNITKESEMYKVFKGVFDIFVREHHCAVNHPDFGYFKPYPDQQNYESNAWTVENPELPGQFGEYVSQMGNLLDNLFASEREAARLYIDTSFRSAATSAEITEIPSMVAGFASISADITSDTLSMFERYLEEGYKLFAYERTPVEKYDYFAENFSSNIFYRFMNILRGYKYDETSGNWSKLADTAAVSAADDIEQGSVEIHSHNFNYVVKYLTDRSYPQVNTESPQLTTLEFVDQGTINIAQGTSLQVLVQPFGEQLSAIPDSTCYPEGQAAQAQLEFRQSDGSVIQYLMDDLISEFGQWDFCENGQEVVDLSSISSSVGLKVVLPIIRGPEEDPIVTLVESSEISIGTFAVPSDCADVSDTTTITITVETNDSYGDGWNGHQLYFYDATNMSTIIATVTLEDGYTGTSSVQVPSNVDNVAWQLIAGSYSDEVSFTFRYEDGTEISSHGGYSYGGSGVIDSGQFPTTPSSPSPVYGCTDPSAGNYDPAATVDDGSCYSSPISGCTDPDAYNHDPNANQDDGSCLYDDGILFTGAFGNGAMVTNPSTYLIQSIDNTVIDGWAGFAHEFVEGSPYWDNGVATPVSLNTDQVLTFEVSAVNGDFDGVVPGDGLDIRFRFERLPYDSQDSGAVFPQYETENITITGTGTYSVVIPDQSGNVAGGFDLAQEGSLSFLLFLDTSNPGIGLTITNVTLQEQAEPLDIETQTGDWNHEDLTFSISMDYYDAEALEALPSDTPIRIWLKGSFSGFADVARDQFTKTWSDGDSAPVYYDIVLGSYQSTLDPLLETNSGNIGPVNLEELS